MCYNILVKHEQMFDRTKGNKKMKRYFVNGKEITKAEADEIIANNNKYMASNDFNDMLKIKFVVVI